MIPIIERIKTGKDNMNLKAKSIINRNARPIACIPVVPSEIFSQYR